MAGGSIMSPGGCGKGRLTAFLRKFCVNHDHSTEMLSNYVPYIGTPKW